MDDETFDIEEAWTAPEQAPAIPQQTPANVLTPAKVDAVRFQPARAGYSYKQVEAFVQQVKDTLDFFTGKEHAMSLALYEAQEEIVDLQEKVSTLQATIEVFRAKGDPLVTSSGEYVTESQVSQSHYAGDDSFVPKEEYENLLRTYQDVLNQLEQVTANNELPALQNQIQTLESQLNAAKADAEEGWKAESELRAWVETSLAEWQAEQGKRTEEDSTTKTRLSQQFEEQISILKLDYERQISEKEQSISSLNAQLAAAAAQHQQVVSEVEGLRQELAAVKAFLETAEMSAQEEKASLSSLLNAEREQNSVFEGQIKDLAAQLEGERLAKEAKEKSLSAQYEKQVQELEQNVNQLLSEKEELTVSLSSHESLTDRVAELEEIVKNADEETTQLKNQLKELSLEKETLEHRLSQRDELVSTQEQVISEIEQEKNLIQQRLETSQTTVNGLEEQLSLLDATVKEMQAELSEQHLTQQAEREKAEREQAEREQAEREQAEQARLAAEQAEREQAEREQAEREQAEREQAEREQAEREQAEREQAEREQAEREQAEREQAEREQAEREQAEREQAEREQAEREQAEEVRRSPFGKPIAQGKPWSPPKQPHHTDPNLPPILSSAPELNMNEENQ